MPRVKKVKNELKDEVISQPISDSMSTTDYDFTDHYTKGDTVYYLRVMEKQGINDVIEGVIRTIMPDYICIVDLSTKQALIVNSKSKHLLYDTRTDAVIESKKYHAVKYKPVKLEDDDSNEDSNENNGGDIE